ncbi:MAG: hypothetical protein KF749_14765 [Bacteroidetes bacterium]|nr:hypothetical protein [Bacteroidota bacterium]MCW5894275.1 hypothetical protein [Bacteroidota bacterium]
MKLMFIDETSDSSNPNYLGVCGALVDATRYGDMKRQFMSTVGLYNWDPSIEFKGSYIFSSSTGCKDVSVDARIRIVDRVIEYTSSPSTARVKFCYAFSTSGTGAEQYLELVFNVASSLAPRKTNQKLGKDVIAIFVDQRTDVTQQAIRANLEPVLIRKGLTLFEDITFVKSSPETVGIAYADIVGYMMSRKDNIKFDASLFDQMDPAILERNGQYRKLKASTEILESIRSIQRIPVIGTIDSANGRIARTDSPLILATRIQKEGR